MEKSRGWYWKEHGHEYERKSVERDVRSFCGWALLIQIIEECERTVYRVSPKWPQDKKEEYLRNLIKRDQALIATCFLTGGRIIEILRLRKMHFSTSEQFIRVTGMETVKRYKKDKTSGETSPVYTDRGRFSIPMDELLVPFMMKWVEETEDYLFPSPSKTRDHITTVRAYQIVRGIGNRLGLHLYDHWFRAQRACQLAEEYDFEVQMLLNWFNWKHVETAMRYSKLSTRKLENQMRPQLNNMNP